MEALERYLQPGSCVADIGCGSGILFMAAKLLGISRRTLHRKIKAYKLDLK